LIADSSSGIHSALAMPYTNRDHAHSAGTETHQAIEFQPNNSCISVRLKTAFAIRKNLPLSLSFLFPTVGGNVTILGTSKLTT
jgi:hypothetical protein